ncbi:MAG: TrmH family RNA methyltransferase [Nitrososphaerales archaeon]
MYRPYNVYDHLQANPVEVNQRISKQSSLGYAVMMVNLYGDRNVGTIIRTATVMGAEKVFLVGKRFWDRRTAIGTHNYIELNTYGGFPDREDLTAMLAPYSPVCIEQGGENLDDLDWSPYVRGDHPPPCFIFGAEDTGLAREFVDLCKTLPGYRCVSIPQVGIVRSMNVATCCGVILYQYTSTCRRLIKDKYSLF